MTPIHDMLKKQNAAYGVQVMGIVNTAPDSFSDGDDGINPVDKALRLLDEGANIIDIGGESTRPGAVEIQLETEIGRVLPVLKQIKKLRPEAAVSIDTRKSRCAEIMLDNGADIINDVSGLTYSKDMADVAAKFNADLIIMHSCGKGCSDAPSVYSDIVEEVHDFLQQQIKFAVSCGVKKEQIIIDPGIGFSKNADENFKLLQHISKFSKTAPVLIGHSRKRFIRDTFDISSIEASDDATALISVLSMLEGASIVRVHNVKQTIDFLKITDKIRKK